MSRDNAPRGVLHNTLAYTVAGLLPYAVSLLMLPLYARALSPQAYGLLALTTAVETLLAIVGGLQIRAALGRHYVDHPSPDALRTLVGTLALLQLGTMAVLLLPIHLFGEQLVTLVFRDPRLTYAPWFELALTTAVLGNLVQYGVQVLIMQERGRTVLAVSLLGTATSAAGGLYWVVLQGRGAHGYLYVGLLTQGVQLAMLAIVLIDFMRPRWSTPMARAALGYSLPLVPAVLGGYLFIQADRLILEQYVALAAIGLYGFADRFASILKALLDAVHRALTPRFLKLAQADPMAAAEAWRGVIRLWSVAAVLACAGLAIGAGDGIRLLIPRDYAGAIPYIPVLLAGYLARGWYLFAQNALSHARRPGLMAASTIGSGVLNVVLNLALIPVAGVWGAAWTTFACYALNAAVAWLLARREFPLTADLRPALGHGAWLLALLLATTVALPRVLDAGAGGSDAGSPAAEESVGANEGPVVVTSTKNEGGVSEFTVMVVMPTDAGEDADASVAAPLPSEGPVGMAARLALLAVFVAGLLWAERRTLAKARATLAAITPTSAAASPPTPTAPATP